MGRIDRDWFIERIEASRFGSQRGLAPHLRNRLGEPITQSNLSRMLSGERLMQLHEAQQLARLLDVPVAEILAHAGVRVNANAMSPDEFARRVRGLSKAKAERLALEVLQSLGYGDGVELIENMREKKRSAG